MKTLYITGAAGFLGKACAGLAHKAGWKVVGVDIAPITPQQQHDLGYSAYFTNALSLGTLHVVQEQVGPPHAVLHCAGGSSVALSYQTPHEDFQRTVGSTAELLEFLRCHAPTASVVYPSSAAVYGVNTHKKLCESFPSQPCSPYGWHKLLAEQLLQLYAQNWNVASCSLRFFSLYGEGLRKQLLWDACCKAVKGNYEFFGTGQEERDWLHISDAARLMLLALEHASAQAPVINAGTGVGTSVCTILTQLGRYFAPARIPVFTGQQKTGDPSCLIAETALLQQWGFSPQISVAEGLKRYYAWFLEAGAHD